ncbi:coiled-coil domain-containing protein 174 [Anopheles nili]|uniref:coiled-coil domain-containing protein 174 n=1 Tax=Anopheles nili TaxID=185578 RepID=UPI00237BD2CC|nr:coiled-coil domain-containing protein 174 [Anopheles nili]
MNDPNRKIEIDKSSLLSLKAELLRKQEEVGRAKASTSVENFVPKKATKSKEDGIEKRMEHGDKKKKIRPIVVELEDSAQLARSKQMLQAKAKYYERMVASGGSLNSDENSLVMFNKKKQDTKSVNILSDDSAQDSSASSSDYGSEGEEESDNKWVEYTDCLGRTRKCLKQDLKECLARDKDLEKSMAPREGQRREDLERPSTTVASASKAPEETATRNLNDVNDADDEGEIVGPMPSAANNEEDVGERFRMMREQWAQQEEANLEKDSMHYQDVLFDEARMHGVGYYAFSTDQQERNRQRDELDTIRESTVEAQKEREALRMARDKLISDRVKAARARQRARLGLPPEVEEEQKNDEAKHEPLYDQDEEKRRSKAEEKLRKKKQKEERRRERERADHVRPWDEGKEQNPEDKEWVPAKERFILSQHEWNDLKRSERIAEFAPPPTDERSRPAGQPPHQDTHRRQSESSEASDDETPLVGPMPPMEAAVENAPQSISLENIPLPEEDSNVRALYFTTKKNSQPKELKRRNLNVVEMSQPAKRTAPVPIRNELSDSEEPENGPCKVQQQRNTGAEIEPPATYEYYGPSDVVAGRHRSRTAPESKLSLEASIEAGLKFLRNQSDKAGGPGTKNRWSSNADY